MARKSKKPASSGKSIVWGAGIGVVVLALVVACVAMYRHYASLSSVAPPPPDARCVATVNGQQASITLEQSRNASIIAGVAASRGLVPRAVSIAITTAFQESGIRNLDYGDLDSLGMFQQRPSQGWGTPEEVIDPYYSTNKFYDVMVTVKDWQTKDIGDVAQAVQRSGYPDAYDKHVDRARTLATALSGQTQAAWSCVTPEVLAPDPSSLSTSMSKAYGATVAMTIVPATEQDPATMTVTAVSAEIAWSVGAFAQSWTSQTGVSAVRVGNVEWRASTSTLSGWVGLSEPDKPTVVTITF